MKDKSMAGQFATPSSLVLFVTGRCNARCSHCFYSGQLNNNDDSITPSRFSFILNSLSAPTNLSLTGGEPFILRNFADYLEIAFTSDSVHSISIPSNGSFSARMKEIIPSFMQRFNKALRLQLSLDGLPDTHNDIRQLANGFSQVLDSARWLQKTSGKFPQLSYVISTTVMKRNQHEIIELIDILKDEGLNHKMTFIRGNDFSTFNVPQEILRADYNSQEELPSTEELLSLGQKITAKNPNFFDSYSQRKIAATLETLERQKRSVPCYAGTRDGVIFHDGTVGLCEQVLPFGHLSQWQWNLEAAWNSDEANRHRALLRQCSCIHGCNISTAVNALGAD